MPRFTVAVLLVLVSAAHASAQNAQPGVVATPAVAASSAAGAGLPTLTLESAVDEAQQNNRQIKIAYQNVLYSNDEILAAKNATLSEFPTCSWTGSGL